MHTLGLAVITNNVAETEKLIDAYYPYFDRFFITVADKNTKVLKELQKKYTPDDKIVLSYFKWVDSFGKARLYNQSQVTTEYWAWMDTDDEITNPENLREIVNQMVAAKVDIMFMNYDYYQNEFGEQQANHWRERIVRTASKCKWEDVPCHETVPSKGIASNTTLCSVRHHKPVDQMLKSMDRNQRLLEKDWLTNKDPRTAFYLGMTYGYHQEYEKALEMYQFMIEHGGWDEQKVTAWNFAADAYYALHDVDKALDAVDQAIRLNPAHPDAYYHKVQYYMDSKQYDKATEWAEMAITKKTDPNTMQLVDPTRYTHRGLFLAAQANLFNGHPEKAFAYYQQVATAAPNFVEQMKRETGIDWGRSFAEGLNEQNAVSAIKFLTSFLKDRGGDIEKLFAALTPKLSYDPNLLEERMIALPPKQWPEKSIVVYCGQGLEAWGPDTLKDGLGGSEEAWVYLSRELAILGWDITVYCERDLDYSDTRDSEGLYAFGACYKPWSQFNPYDDFDVFVAWRRPEFVQNVKARKKILDLHDTMPEESVMAMLDQVDMIMTKSDYHRSLYPKVPDDKISVVTNGIYKDLNYV